MRPNLWNRARRGNGALLPLAAVLLLLQPSDVWVERDAVLMGATFHAYVGARDRQHGLTTIDDAFGAVRHVDSLLSNWREDSQIGSLNRAPIGTAIHLNSELYGMLVEARGWSEATGGAFDPGMGALTDAWDLRGSGRHPSPDELAAARAASGLDQFVFDDQTHTVRRTLNDSWFDTGGFGKGIALRWARRALREGGVESALINFGGQILAIGSDEREQPWEVTVPHPSRRRTPAVTLAVRDASVSTTSQSERFVTLYGARFGHVLDPRSGTPVPAWGSVTVVADDPGLADVMSTALFVMGPDSGLAWLGDRTDIAALFLVERNGRLEPRMNPPMRRYVVRLPE